MLDDFIHQRMRIPYTLHVERLRWPKRPRATIVLIHGIGSSTLMWHKLASDLPDDVRIIAVDLLGFGQSPQPGWAKYDAPTQANSLIKTLILNRVPLGSIFVGHSLGALVAVEVARRVPRYPSHLLLVSPPIYKPPRNKVVATQREDVLRGMYKILHRYPKNAERGLLLAKQYYVHRTGSEVTQGINIATYLASLEASIINQNTINHITDIRPPISILSGSRDPLVIGKNLQSLAATQPTIQHRIIKRAGHNVVGHMATALSNEIAKEINICYNI